MSKHLAPESLGTKAMERLELTLCNVYGRRSSIQGQGRHRAESTDDTGTTTTFHNGTTASFDWRAAA